MFYGFKQFTTGSKYNIIYADPPWEYRDRAMQRGGAARHYKVLSVKDVCTLPVEKVVSKNSVLFLWCTFPNLPQAFKVIDAWGFTYKTVGFVWIKKNKSGNLFTGMGHYTRSNAEICLLARKGKGLPRIKKNVHSVVLANRTKHSAKPAEVRDRIVSLYGENTNRLELFARESTPGWDSWGDEL